MFSADADPIPGPSVRLALALLRGYKLAISPVFAGSCRFLPSCSDYAREAVLQYGVLRGSWLAARRIARCHPFAAAGYDPVPGRSNTVEPHCCRTNATPASPELKS